MKHSVENQGQLLESENAFSEPTRYQPHWESAIALADGRIFYGLPFGASVEAVGEIVFTTTMTGYQEVCTDPSFFGQIVCMTYPLIGNYGVNEEDDESRKPWIAGLVVREQCGTPSNWRSEGSLDSYLKRHNIPGIYGVDTRALTRHIRTVGDMRAVLIPHARGTSAEELVERARQAPLPGDRNVVEDVILDEPQTFGDPGGPHIVILDCGVKRNIVESLVQRGARATVLPYGTPYEDLQALSPDGVIVSPGPGDPVQLDDGMETLNQLLERRIPYFGICLGHQLLARSIGAETGKLKFGHRGGNHPVLDLRTGKVTITSQNHGFYVDEATLPESDEWRVTRVNLNDRSVEGLESSVRPALSVQFHPEASPGPWDNSELFDEFLALIEREKAGGRR
jgi:carbamoyl-phosphate synthase small subunit